MTVIKLNIVTIAPFCFPRSRPCDSVSKRLHEQNFIFFFLSWLLKMRDGELQTQKHKQKRENGSVSNYQNSFLAPGLKGIKLVHEKVYETFDFTEIESVMILCFFLKASKKNGGLDWNKTESAIRRSFLGESRRTPPKRKGKKERLIAG